METLIVKYLSGEASEAEAKTLHDWIALSEENSRQFADAKQLFDAADGYFRQAPASLQEINLDHEWNQFKTTVTSAPVIPITRKVPAPVWMKAAAALLVVVVSGFIITWFVTRDQEVVWETADASQLVRLPDSSKVWLNVHSKMVYRSSFAVTSRTVTLTGEGYFDVVHDDKLPFIVRTNNTVVEDVGTKFDVRSYPDDHMTEVMVEQGEVRFSVPEYNKEVSLTAGQSAAFENSSKSIVSKPLAPNVLSWNTRKLVFEDTDLRTVVATLNRMYGANITVAASVPATCTITVSFDHQSLEAVLHVLETTLQLTIDRADGKTDITDAGC